MYNRARTSHQSFRSYTTKVTKISEKKLNLSLKLDIICSKFESQTYENSDNFFSFSPEEIQQIIIDFDEDGNEVIDFQEFLKMMKFHTQNNKEKPDEELRNAIK